MLRNDICNSWKYRAVLLLCSLILCVGLVSSGCEPSVPTEQSQSEQSAVEHTDGERSGKELVVSEYVESELFEPASELVSDREYSVGEGTSVDAGSTEHTASTIYRVMSVNVGNADINNCRNYSYKICLERVLEAVRDGVARHKPHLIAMQEVFPADYCKKIDEQDPLKLCYGYKQDFVEPVRRILGDDYTIVCDTRHQFDCIAVHIDAGTIAGCERGKHCVTAETAAGVQHCDDGFSVSAADVTLGKVSLRVVNAHPDSLNRECRKAQLQQIFEKDPLLARGSRVIAMGDFNLDPYRTDPKDDPSVALWHNFVGEGKAFYYHSGIAEHDPPYPTDLLQRTIDHVISNFARGVCKTLGQAPGTERIDGEPPTLLAGLDHLALLCELELE
jgi:hypothetical protein